MNPTPGSEPTHRPGAATASLRLEVQGIGIHVEAPSALLDRLRDRLGAAASLGDRAAAVTVSYRLVGDDDGVRFERPDGPPISGGDEIGALDALADHLHGVVGNRSTAGLFVHAAAFAFGDRLVLVPGPSQAGKSSLVACAVAHGATYFSDEYAIIDERALVHPYPRPISLRTPHGAALRHADRDLGGTIAPAPARAWLVLVTSYVPGATWRPEVLTGSRAALPIIANTVHARRLAAATMSTAARIANEATVVEGPRGEADAMMSELEQLVRSLPDPAAGAAGQECA